MKRSKNIAVQETVVTDEWSEGQFESRPNYSIDLGANPTANVTMDNEPSMRKARNRGGIL